MNQKTEKNYKVFWKRITNYVSKFLPNTAQLTFNVRALNKKDVPFIWGKNQQNEFDKLKCLLCKPSTLAYFDLKKECLAIVYGCKRFEQFFFGQRFKVQTDHKPLVPIFEKPLNKCPPRLQRMLISLQIFDFKLEYIPGKLLTIADQLSRNFQKITDNINHEIVSAYVAMIEENLNISDNRLEDIKNETVKDIEQQEVLKYIRNGWPNNKSEVSESAKPYLTFNDELSEINGIIYKGNCIVVPYSRRKLMLQKIQYEHFGIEKCKRLARQLLYWPGMSKQINDLVEKCDLCDQYQNANAKEPMISKQVPQNPWEILSNDLFYLLEKNYYCRYL